MTKQILLNEKPFQFHDDYLPCFIHGFEHSGASLFTVTLAAHLFGSGRKLIFLSGYPMAKEEFVYQTQENNIETVNNLSDSAKIHEAKALFLLEKQKDALSTLLTQLPDANERLVIIKNIELFDEQFISQFITMKNIILSGNFQKAEYIQQQFRSEINTSILFSPLPNQKFPHVKQYSGYLSSGRGNGVVSIKQE